MCMYIYILYSHDSPFIKNAVVGSPRLNAGVIDSAASRAAPAAPISPLRQRGGLLQATAGTRHDTVLARSTVNDLVINYKMTGGTTYVHEFKDFKDGLGVTKYEDRWRPLKGSAFGHLS